MSVTILKILFSVFLFIKTYSYSISSLKNLNYKKVFFSLTSIFIFSAMMVILLNKYENHATLSLSINDGDIFVMISKLVVISILINTIHQALCTILLYLKNQAKVISDTLTKDYLLLITNSLLLIVSYGTVCLSIVFFQNFVI